MQSKAKGPHMSETAIGCLGLIALLILFASGIELAFAMIIIGFLGFAYLRTFNAAVLLLGKDFFDTFSSYGFTVIPLFVLMGQAAFNSGMAAQLYGTARKFIGHYPGGLAIATVGGAGMFKAISGSSLATAATFSSVAIPEMDKYGYGRKLSTGVVASVGTLGLLLPPSSNLIVFAMITDQSIGTLFMAGIVPGSIIACLFLLVIIGWVKINPAIAPSSQRIGWAERMRDMPLIIWPLVIFGVTIGGLLGGIFTPTESGAVGAISVLILTISLRDLDFKGFIASVTEALSMSCMVLILIAGSQVLGHFVEMSKIPMVLAEWSVSLPVPPWVIMVMIIFIYLLGGSFIDDAAFMILATPIFFPVVVKLGFNPIWFAMVIGVTLMAGVIIPPVAVSVFIVKSIAKENIWLVYKGVTPFLIAIAIGMVLLFVFPGIATWLPNLTMK
jgi:C4-dicarboxylate transporter, DctM subunit